MHEGLGGIRLARDPLGSGLFVRCNECDFGNYDYIVILNGRAAIIIIDGTFYLIKEPGRHRLPETGIWSFFPGIQFIPSYGRPVHCNEVYFFDNIESAPDVYRDLQFNVSGLLCPDKESNYLVNLNPTINCSVQIVDPVKFFREMKQYDFSDEGVEELIHNRISPWIRQELYTALKEISLMDINANRIDLGAKLDSILKDLLGSYGLNVKNSQVLDYGISEADREYLRRRFEKRSDADLHAKIIHMFSNELFAGNTDKGAGFDLMEGALKKEGGLNPLFLLLMDKYRKDGDSIF